MVDSITDDDYARYPGGAAVGSNASLDKWADKEYLTTLDTQLEIATALVYEHPDYVANKHKWDKYTNCYEAQDIYSYIFRHLRESDAMFDNRVRRGYYYNYVASVVDLFVAYLFHSPITRNLGSLAGNDLDEIYKDADLCGTSYYELMVMASTYSQINGHCGILVDLPKVPDGGFANEAARLAAKHRPYCTIIHAPQILDWELDTFGRFEWVKIEISRPQDRSFREPVDEAVRYFLIWSRTDWQEWKLTENEALLIDSGEHNLGEVPLVIVHNERMPRHPWMGLSAVRDIADINIAILNWSSLQDEEVYERCLNILTMEKDQGNASAEISHHNVLEYSNGANPPQYLTPGSTPLELIGKQIDRAKDEIYRLAKLGGSTGLMGVREATSGIAYAYEFNETNQSLAKKAQNLASSEVKIHRLFALWMGEQFDGTIEYAQEFGVEDFLMEFQILAEGRLGFTSDSAVQEMEKRVANKMFARESMELRAKILAEIEAADPRKPLEYIKRPSDPTGVSKGGDTGGQGNSNTGKPGNSTTA